VTKDLFDCFLRSWHGSLDVLAKAYIGGVKCNSNHQIESDIDVVKILSISSKDSNTRMVVCFAFCPVLFCYCCLCGRCVQSLSLMYSWALLINWKNILASVCDMPVRLGSCLSR
jgi:hypothetical protein